MPLKSRALMLAVMTVWLTAIFFIWRGLGQPLPPRPPDPVQPAASAAPAPAPAPAAPVDELADYGPCPDSGSGQGTVKSLSGHYDEQGRYVSLLTVEGRLGAHRVRHLLARSLDKVTYVDFQGNFRLETSLKHEHKGPASLMHLGRHNGFFRYSLNYRPSQAPSHTAVEVRCKDGGLALRYSFGAPQPTAAAAPVMTPVPAPAPTPQPAGFQRCPSQSSALPAGQGIFSGLKGRYDDQGRYVLSMRLDGRLGAAKIRNYLNRPSKNVTAVDFAGTYRVDRLDYWEAAGPARLAQFGLHKGFLRLSLNFRDGQAPAKVDVEFLCRNEELILRYSFEPRPQAAPAPAGFTSTTIKPFAPALAPSAPLEPAAPEALRPEAAGTAVPPAGRPEVEMPADLAAERRTAADLEPDVSPVPPTSSTETTPPEPAALPAGRPEVETP
ncbi:MAG: hypothetical protein LBU12_05270, partial [Deltaproteobacteria bacterium]|nr:hypothetical protein [Deltaproteobacteria bacterium]